MNTQQQALNIITISQYISRESFELDMLANQIALSLNEFNEEFYPETIKKTSNNLALLSGEIIGESKK